MLRQWLRKEWHDQGGKLGLGTVALAVATALGLQTRIMPDEQVVMLSAFAGAALVPMLAVMDVFANDRESDTWRWQMALPVSRARLTALKVDSAVVVSAVPLVTTALVAVAMTRGREMEARSILTTYAAGVWVATQLVVWSVALGYRVRHGFAAAFLPVAVGAAWLLGGMLSQTVRVSGLHGGLVIIVPFTDVVAWPYVWHPKASLGDELSMTILTGFAIQAVALGAAYGLIMARAASRKRAVA